MPSIVRGADDFESDDVDFTIIYPNGGTEATPANVAINSRYVEANPFPGHRVICEAEISISSEWGNPKFVRLSGTGGQGVAAHQLNDSDDIIVQTGNSHLAGISNLTGNCFNLSSDDAGPRWCRVKVWKVKGATV